MHISLVAANTTTIEVFSSSWILVPWDMLNSYVREIVYHPPCPKEGGREVLIFWRNSNTLISNRLTEYPQREFSTIPWLDDVVYSPSSRLECSRNGLKFTDKICDCLLNRHMRRKPLQNGVMTLVGRKILNRLTVLVFAMHCYFPLFLYMYFLHKKALISWSFDDCSSQNQLIPLYCPMSFGLSRICS